MQRWWLLRLRPASRLLALLAFCVPVMWMLLAVFIASSVIAFQGKPAASGAISFTDVTQTVWAMAQSGNAKIKEFAYRLGLVSQPVFRVETVVARALASQSDAVRHLALKMASSYPVLRPTLAEQLANLDPAVQIAALSAIADLHQQDRFSDVTPYLASKVRAVSAAAARTLVALDPNAAKRVLEEGLNSKSSYVRIHSAAMLLGIAERSHGR